MKIAIICFLIILAEIHYLSSPNRYYYDSVIYYGVEKFLRKLMKPKKKTPTELRRERERERRREQKFE